MLPRTVEVLTVHGILTEARLLLALKPALFLELTDLLDSRVSAELAQQISELMKALRDHTRDRLDVDPSTTLFESLLRALDGLSKLGLKLYIYTYIYIFA